MEKNRIVVYPADLQRWYNVKEAAALRRFRKIRETLKLEKDQPLTIYHLSDLWKMDVEYLVRSMF